jgi:signal transduction histidine kinase
VNVATRITAAATLVAALTSGGYAYVDVRSRAASRQEALELEARSVALLVRTTLEAMGPDGLRGRDLDLGRDLTRAGAGWRISILPRNLATADGGHPDATPPQIRRLRTMLELPALTFAQTEGNDFLVALPLRAKAASTGQPMVTGMVEVRRDTGHLDSETGGDAWRAASMIALVSLLTTLAVGFLARNLMTHPITKLLEGIDDVAKGDLSHVLLSERDDEIGRIATRFNEMTFSLRESRAETERQNEAKLSLEQRLSHTEKLATIGQLAAEIAHEVGTPLGVIAGRARASQRKAHDADAVEKNATIIAEQTARITKIIQRLLDFARRRVGPPERVRVHVNQLVLSTVELLSGQLSSARVRAALFRAENLPWVAGDPDRIQQVLLNLLLNAVQAMPDGGLLRIETRAVTRQRPGLELAPEQAFVLLEITDSGVGIPPDIRDKIFEPFYTSKEGQGGTGLGLAVCSGIVKEHDGWMEVHDALGGGTQFRVFLPAGAGDLPESARNREPRDSSAPYTRQDIRDLK